jgi:multidrug efflux pump subunit AcrA (membrane-fusion protein)
MASKIGYAEPSIIEIGDNKLEVRPSYITVDAVAGPLYAVYFPIPDSYHRSLTNLSYVEVSIPVGVAETGGAFPFIAIDSVYQSGGKAYVFTEKDGVASSREVKLGDVSGSYVTVIDGLKTGDSIILNRNILSGDLVTY